MKLLYIICCLAITISGCKKEKLEGDYAWIQGTYEWTHTIISNNPFNTGIGYSTMNPHNQEARYGIRILSSGTVHVYKDGNRINRFRIIDKSTQYGYTSLSLERRTEGTMFQKTSISLHVEDVEIWTFDNILDFDESDTFNNRFIKQL